LGIVVSGSVDVNINVNASFSMPELKQAATTAIALMANVPEWTVNVTITPTSPRSIENATNATSMRHVRRHAHTELHENFTNTASYTIRYEIESQPPYAEREARTALEVLSSMTLEFVASAINAELPPGSFMVWVTALLPPTTDVRAIGDPHMVNVHGEQFDIKRGGRYTFLNIPRYVPSTGERSLSIRALVNPLKGKGLCTGQMYITGLRLTGEWLFPLRSLEFSVKPANRLVVNDNGPVDSDAFAELLPPRMGKVKRLHPAMPKNIYKHVDYLTVKLSLGPTDITVGWAHNFKPRANWLWMSMTGLGQVRESMGGLLGEDSHRVASTKPRYCDEAGPFASFEGADAAGGI